MKKILAFVYTSIACLLIIPAFPQTINGCFIGAYLGCGSQDSSCILPASFNAISGKPHYCFSRYIDAGNDNDLLNPSHWQWVDTLSAIGAKPVFFLMPFGGLSNYYNGARDASLGRFADSCANFNGPVYIVFGHEMNGSWNPFGTASDYVSAFQHVSSLMRGTAQNIRFCWVPIQAYGQNPYLPYYPGDSYVDWVGLNLYDRDYDENNQFFDNQLDAAISYLNFYHDFSEVKNKPFIIGENSLFDPNYDPTPAGVRVPLNYAQQSAEKNQWISSLYNKDSLQSRYPNLNMIIFFHVKKLEQGFSSQTHNFGNITVDWRIPFDSGYDIYSGLIQDPYFIGGSSVGIHNETSSADKKCRIKIFPNPCNNEAEISFYLSLETEYIISVADLQGRTVKEVSKGKKGKGIASFHFATGSIPPGAYILRLSAGKDSCYCRFVKTKDADTHHQKP